MRLSELIEGLGGTCELEKDVFVEDVHLDSRRVGRGSLFAALPGTREDGARYARDAARSGAVAVLAPRSLEDLGRIPVWLHPEARRIAGEAAALVFGRPSRENRMVGVTGTNGKSTVAHLVGQMLAGLGHRPGVVGTIEVRLWGTAGEPATRTTPDGPELQRLCRRNRELGGDSFVLEVSSHALDQERLAGLELDVGIFTNLGHDHLDYHLDLEAYALAKERLFERLKPAGAAVINADDPACDRMRRAAERHGKRVVTYGTRSRADLSATLAEASPAGTTLFLEGMGIPRTGLFLPLVGRHNAENALAALAAVLLLGASPANAIEGLASISAPRGRLEPVESGARGFRVFVDFAHTPEALERVLGTLREFLGPDGFSAAGRLICVFGCGGNRDREKRVPMGRAVARFADLALVTSDNPRDEDPLAIIGEILPGLARGRARTLVEPDRRHAIARALSEARTGDIVLIAGKGHETWQELRDRRIPFEDRRVASAEL